MNRLVTALYVLLLASSQVEASVISNGSFESLVSNDTPSLPIGSTYLDDWTVINAEIAHCLNCAGAGSASEGSLSLDLTGYHDGTPYGGVEQLITTVPLQVYEISFDVGARNGTAAVQISAGTLLATGASTSGGNEVVWTKYKSTFTALGTTTAVDLVGTQSSWGGIFIGLDNVSVVPVPEPTAGMALMGSLATLAVLLHRGARPSRTVR